jgi:hypothetical protein
VTIVTARPFRIDVFEIPTDSRETASADQRGGWEKRKADMTYLLYPVAIMLLITGSAMQFL